MSNASDRRAPGTARIPFDAMVEVGGALGPSFEAQAVNLSEEGMQLRTAYLPEVGQPVMCRFDAGQGLVVVAAGEVLWKEDVGDGGEFGIRFTNLDGSSTVALQRILGMAEDGVLPAAPQGRKVRLHIDGLASPMRARVRDQHDVGVTAYSELGFLQVGKPLDLEDAMSGSRRAALIDKVAVDVDRETRIPQLVVTLRYDDTDARAMSLKTSGEEAIPVDETTAREGTPEPPAAMAEERAIDDDVADVAPAASTATRRASEDDIDAESSKLKGAFARGAAKVTPALRTFASRAKTTIALIAARARAKAAEGDAPVRRTTAPAPGGGLHAAGRKVVRGSMHDDRLEEEPPKPRFKITKKKAIVAGALGTATLLAFFAMRKPSAPPQLAAAPPAETTPSSLPAAPTQSPLSAPVAPPSDPLAAAAAAMGGGLTDTGPDPHGRRGKPAPFTNGPVGAHGNVIKLRMDGPVDRILGASQPTGFTVVIPGRKSMDASGPLASKDARIAALRVANEPTGAELTVSFKDGVPNYLVRARGESLEIVLARPASHGDKSPAAHATKKKKGKKR